MARATRIALDLTLISLKKVTPVLSNLWLTAKTAIGNTKARPIVYNPIVDKTESALSYMQSTTISFITSLRDGQLPKEKEYLERELEKINKRISSKVEEERDRTL